MRVAQTYGGSVGSGAKQYMRWRFMTSATRAPRAAKMTITYKNTPRPFMVRVTTDGTHMPVPSALSM